MNQSLKRFYGALTALTLGLSGCDRSEQHVTLMVQSDVMTSITASFLRPSIYPKRRGCFFRQTNPLSAIIDTSVIASTQDQFFSADLEDGDTIFQFHSFAAVVVAKDNSVRIGNIARRDAREALETSGTEILMLPRYAAALRTRCLERLGLML
jgi:hypothetical protein